MAIFRQCGNYLFDHGLIALPNYGITWNGTLLVSVPLGVTTVTNPVLAPGGTIARIKVSDTTVKLAEVPLRKTSLVPVRPCPRMPPVCPTFPDSRTSLTKGLSPIETRNTVPQ